MLFRKLPVLHEHHYIPKGILTQNFHFSYGAFNIQITNSLFEAFRKWSKKLYNNIYRNYLFYLHHTYTVYCVVESIKHQEQKISQCLWFNKNC